MPAAGTFRGKRRRKEPMKNKHWLVRMLAVLLAFVWLGVKRE